MHEAQWNVDSRSLLVRNPIELDFHNYCYMWRSECGRVELKLHFNKRTVWIRYPVRVPTSVNDEYEQKMQGVAARADTSATSSSGSRHLHKYVYNEEEFAASNVPPRWQQLYERMTRLVDKLNAAKSRNMDNLADVKAAVLESEKEKQECDSTTARADKNNWIVVKLPEAMPLSCHLTHLHKFDSVDTVSEPKIIYLNHTWHKFVFKNCYFCKKNKKGRFYHNFVSFQQ
jgi:hypothetical protein